jgi:hypothetical protein
MGWRGRTFLRFNKNIHKNLLLSLLINTTDMKQRILTGWSFRRALFLILGLVMIVQSVMEQQWFGVALGGYFASMGLFSFGCAGGACFGGTCQVDEPNKSNVKDITFEEVK